MSGKLALHSIDHGDGPVSLADDRIPSRNLLAYADLASLAVFALVLANDVMRQAFVHWRVSGSIALVAAIIDGPYICGGPVSTVPLILVPSVCACTTWLYLRGQRGALIRSLVILPALAAWFLLASAGAWLIATFVVFVVSCLLMRMPPDLLAEKIAVRRLPLRRPSADSQTLMCLSVGVVMGLGLYVYLAVLNGAVSVFFESIERGRNAWLFRSGFAGRLGLVLALRGSLLTGALAFYLVLASVYLMKQVDRLKLATGNGIGLADFIWPFAGAKRQGVQARRCDGQRDGPGPIAS